MINPLSGDGIQYALLSSRWAAQTLEVCVKNDRFSEESLRTYTTKVLKEVGYDFALSNLLVQFPRNKSLTQVWMQILSVLIARAKQDKAYADIIAGIFEGTYPSYKALTIPFILKSLKQGGIEIVKTLEQSLQHPDRILEQSSSAFDFLFKFIEEFERDPKEQLKWAGDTVTKTKSVMGYLVKSIDFGKLGNSHTSQGEK